MAADKTLESLRQLPVDDLRQKISTVRKELFLLRVHQVSGRVERPSQFRVLRLQLARLLTLVREDERRSGQSNSSGMSRSS